MTLQSLTTLAKVIGAGFEGPGASDVDLKSVLTELQGYTMSPIAILTSATCGAITGMTAADTIKTVLWIPATHIAWTDVTAKYSAAAGGLLCNKDADSLGKGLVVFWVNAAGA